MHLPIDHKTFSTGLLIFYYPDETKELMNGFNCVIEVVKRPTHPAKAREQFLQGVQVLDGPLPESGEGCGGWIYLCPGKQDLIGS